MTPARLVSAAAALLLFGAALTAATLYVRRLETRYVHAVAPQMFGQKNQGVALQRAAFRQPDLLPFYGSSDLNVRNRYHASALFRDYPTGFTVFPVGNVGSASLIWLQALAAVGADLQGKKVALSIAARSFLNDMADAHAYAANFSELHASEFAFSTRLGFAVKRDVARRMLQYPDTLANDPLLTFALERLADGSVGSRILYYASLPLGTLHNFVLRLQDDWQALVFLRAQVGWGAVARRGVAIDWTALLSRAQQDTRRQTDNNPFGFENEFWAAHAAEIAMQKGAYARAAVQRPFDDSAEWTDLALLLRVVRDLGGEPLLLSLPMNGVYSDYLGVPFAARRAYSERLRELARTSGATVVDFADHDSDKYFTIDTGLHLSATGWVHYDQALDAFFHGQRPDNM